jgi:hypothetical protein
MTPGTIYLPNGAVIRQRAAPMPVVPRSRLSVVRVGDVLPRPIIKPVVRVQRFAHRPHGVTIYAAPIGPDPIEYHVVPAVIYRSPIGPTLTGEPMRMAPRVDTIIATVGSIMGVAPWAIKSHGRKNGVALARLVAMYVARRQTSFSTKQLGARFGRDHTTIVSAIARVRALMDGNDAISQRVRAAVEAAQLELDRG